MIGDLDIEKTQVSRKVPLGDCKKVMVGKPNVVFFIEDGELLERYNSIWNRVSNSIKKEKELNCEPIYNKSFLKTKINSYDDEAKDFYNKKIT